MVIVGAANSAFGQEGYGTVTFTVEVTGTHNVPFEGGGFRNTEKSRIFRGHARLKYAGQGFAAPPMKGYDRASFEREKDACERNSSDEHDIAACQDEVQKRQNAAERAAMQTANPVTAAAKMLRTDVWANESCSGELEVADRGTHRRLNPYEGGWREVPTSLTAKRTVEPDAQGSDGCSFNLTYDPNTRTAMINIDPGPLRLDAVEKDNQTITKTNINPFDWTALNQFEKTDIAGGGSRTGHTGAWNEAMGNPIALAGASRVKGELVKTNTRVTWTFSGRPSTAKPRAVGHPPPQQTPPRDQDPLAGCLQEEKEAGRDPPDSMRLLECMQKKTQ